MNVCIYVFVCMFLSVCVFVCVFLFVCKSPKNLKLLYECEERYRWRDTLFVVLNPGPYTLLPEYILSMRRGGVMMGTVRAGGDEIGY